LDEFLLVFLFLELFAFDLLIQRVAVAFWPQLWGKTWEHKQYLVTTPEQHQQQQFK
jgi:hypothetical protein